MSYELNVQNGVLVAVVKEKRATVDISGPFKEDLIKHISEGNKNVIVDLSSVEFVDSSFLGALVAGLKKTTLVNGDLKISGLQPPVRAMFELTRLYRIFDIFESVEEAQNSF
ncbi:MAG TPA: anti-sigma factor antagonist [Caldithrix abyssi]|uniref:Anti-sigma factor antagonist n=1 Tax=Caldithrix abyssi TaxID=187145 RepID=A0A7V4WV65_CALAY|nr:anti-sigma factor antagonist [Caldithrix abyssi]